MKHSSPPPLPEEDVAAARQKACAAALRLLARREHSVLELRYKLETRHFAAAVVDAVLTDLCDQGLLSDARFADTYVRTRAERGFGPLRIRAELNERGIAADLTTQVLATGCAGWIDSAALQRSRRFGDQLPADSRERARQMRFLQQRGFSTEHIRAVFRGAAGQ